MSNVTRQKKAKSLQGERWKKIETPRPTLKMDYYVSNLGRLKSRSKTDNSEHILNPTPDAKDYLKSSIKLEGGSYGLYVHMAVAKYWSKKPKKAGYNRYIHKNLNRLDNKAANIVWVTDDEWRDYVRNRAKKYGYKPHRKGGKPKLTEKQVIQIKKHLAAGRMPKSKIAAKFSVSHTQINRIEAGENWARLEVPGLEKKASQPAAKRKPAAKKAAAAKAKPAAKRTAAKAKPAAKKTTTRAKKSTATAKKTTARKTTAAKAKPAAKKAAATKAKPAAKRTAAKAKPAANKTTTRAKKSTATAKKTTAAKAKPAAKKAAATKAKPAARRTAAKAKPAANKTTTRAKKSTATAKKTTARKTTAAKAKPTAKKAAATKAKPAAKRTAAKAKPAAKKTTTRSRKKK